MGDVDSDSEDDGAVREKKSSHHRPMNWAGEQEGIETLIENAGPRASRSLRLGGMGKSTGHTGHEVHLLKRQRREELKGMEEDAHSASTTPYGEDCLLYTSPSPRD